MHRELGDLGKLHDPKQAEAVEAAQKKAKEFVGDLYHHVKILDSGARDATLTFVRKNQGDVLIAWENEALQETQGAGAEKFDVVTPSISILAEPPVAVVDAIVDRLGTRKVAEEYLKYLYSAGRPEDRREKLLSAQRSQGGRCRAAQAVCRSEVVHRG